MNTKLINMHDVNSHPPPPPPPPPKYTQSINNQILLNQDFDLWEVNLPLPVGGERGGGGGEGGVHGNEMKLSVIQY